MKIIDLFNGSDEPLLSLEIFPPKKEYPVETVFETIEQLKDLHPNFISVTYGAGGSTRERTVEIASRIKRDYGIETIAHLTCMEHSKEEVDWIMDQLIYENVHNIMALRGDPPADGQGIAAHLREYHYARELIEDARKKADFGIFAAAYPEGHTECRRLSEDLHYLKEKVDAGVDALITQLFFDNRKFYDFVEKARQMGINCPIIPGIMPLLNAGQIKRMVYLSGASVTAEMLLLMDKYEKDSLSMEHAGIEYASRQIMDLLDNGIPGIHLYTMNKYQQIKQICSNTGI